MRIRPSSRARRREPATEAGPELRVSPPAAAASVERVLRSLPLAAVEPLRVAFRGPLWVRRGKLRSRPPGTAVHAASLLRRRKILLEGELLGNPAELKRILIHELFHFVWVRLGNAIRRSWERLLERELRAGARGELGFSALRRKQRLQAEDRRGRTRRWRDYACEAFADTAAWLFLGRPRHAEFTLVQPWRGRRARWFAAVLEQRILRL